MDELLEPIADEQPDDPELLASDASAFCNCTGVESDPEAMEIIDGYIQNGWLAELLAG